MTQKLSIVSPVYMGEQSVQPLADRIRAVVEPMNLDFEIILVEDGSPDRSWDQIVKCCISDTHVKGIKLSRNFGQHYAITAGIEAASGDLIIVMDCDLQDDPVYIPQLIAKSADGFDIVYTLKKERKHPFFKNLVSSLFYRIFNFLLDNPDHKADTRTGAYSLITRKAADALLMVHDYHRHYLMILKWLGFNHSYIEIEHQRRAYGKSSYDMAKLIRHAINGITSQSNRLLYLSIGIGLFVFIGSSIAIIFLIIMYFIQGFQHGWASLFVLILFSTGLIMLSLGITGTYIAKIFDQAKNRPLYIIDKKINFDR